MNISNPLTAELLDDVRQTVKDGGTDAALSLSLSGVTLGAALEWVCWLATQPPRTDAERRLRQSWLNAHSLLQEASYVFNNQGANFRPSAIHGAPQYEFRGIRAARDTTCDEWQLFVERFRRSLVQAEFSPALARSVTKCLSEMSDNLVQHSGESDATPARGLVGFQVRPRCFSFGVADIGRGVLKSLRTNPRHLTLGNARQALDAAIREAATRRPDEVAGDGFRQMHRWLADLNGVLRFRSDDSSLSLEGKGVLRRASTLATPFLGGFQVSVVCSLDELPINVSL